MKILKIKPVIYFLITFNLFLIGQENDLQTILQFESAPVDMELPGWRGGPPETIHFDSTIVHSGWGAARLERHINSPNNFSTITKSFPIDFDGQDIELKGYLRTDSVSGFAGLWMRQDGPSGVVQFDNMQNKGLKATNEWAEYSIKLPLDKNARKLVFGVLVLGEGTVWADDLQLLVDGKPINLAPKRIIEPTILDTDKEFLSGSGILDSSLTEIQLENLFLLGKIWGFIKYHHPRVAKGDFHWDFELFRILPDVLSALDKKALQKILGQWLNRIGLPDSCAPCAGMPDDVHLLPQTGWINDNELMGRALSEQLQKIYTNRFSGDEQFYISMTPGVGNPQFKNELSYEKQHPPDSGYRILALFRLWNMIEYWFPYRNQLDDDWNDVLREFLPRLVKAGTWDNYRLEMLGFIARIYDTHANLWQANDIIPPVGDCFWPVEIRFIKGNATVVALQDSLKGAASNLQIGDIIKSIDGISVDSLIEEWSPYYCASNKPRRLHAIARFLPRGECRASILNIDRAGRQMSLIINRVKSAGKKALPHDRPGDTFQLLSDDVAYIKLSGIRVSDVKNYIEKAFKTKGLIIDIRNYPSEFVVFALGQHLVDKPTPFARFTIADLNNPGTFFWTKPIELNPEAPGYKGKIAILVDEISISQSEYTAMAFRASDRAVVVGSTTAGADGNVSRINLPGVLQTSISGIGVFYPDKTPTQRIGIIPDIEVKPTIEGIIADRDQVLEAAILYILGENTDKEMIREMTK